MGAAGHFLAVDPQPDFAIDGPDVIMVPLTDTLAQVLSRKTPLAVRRRWRKWLHGGGAGREHVAVGRKPVRLLFRLLLVLLGITVIEDLHFNTGGKPPFSLFQGFNRFGRSPDKNPGVAARLQMTPLRDQLEVRVKLDRPDHAYGLARAMDHPIRPRPRVGIAVDVDEMIFVQRVPTGSGAVDDGLGKHRRLLRAGTEDNAQAANRCGGETTGKESVHIHSRSRLSWLNCAS